MIFIFLLLFYFSLGNLTFATHVPKCIAAHVYHAFSTCQNEVLYKVNYDVKVDVSGDLEFPNKISFLNFTEWSLDPSKYFLNGSYVFYYDDTYVLTDTWDPKNFSIHSFDFPNAKISWSFQVIEDTSPTDIGVFEIFIDNRNMFYYWNGSMTSYSKPCILNYSSTCLDVNHTISRSFCCTDFEYIDIPDSAQDVCDLFESNSFIYNTSGTLVTMNVLYSVNYFLYINITNFISFTPNSYQLEYNGFHGWIYGCNGNNTNPQSSCRPLIFSMDEFQMNIDFFLYKSYVRTYGINIAKFIYRNGIYLKDDYSLFTPSSPCWNVNSPIPYSDGKMGNNSFCCIHFMDKTTTTTQAISTISLTTLTTQITTTPPLLTTKQSLPPGSCILYNSTTKVLDNSAFLEVNYELDRTTMIVKIINYFASKDSTVSLEAFNTVTFSQSCRASTASPENTCYFTLSTDNQYELKMRTSTMPDGFNMLQIIEEKGQIIVPKLNSQYPCYSETNPYNYGNSNLQATTIFCCSAFA